jgi:hypothetical protein
MNYSMNEDTPLQQQVSEMLALCSKVKEAGIDVSEVLITLIILLALPASYNAMVNHARDQRFH